MIDRWDPDRYLVYADERGRPFVDLLARVRRRAPRLVVDLGCGPGNLTRLLGDRWPDARVVGVDSSAEMIAAADPRVTLSATGRLDFEVGDVRTWSAGEPVDVLVSNATLQWVPGHLDLLSRLVGQVRPGGWFAFQVPGNFGAPSHVILHELAAQAPYDEHTAGRGLPRRLKP